MQTKHSHEPPIDNLLRLPEVLAIFPVSRSCFLQGVKDGRYPKPHRISARSVAWSAEDIRQLISEVSK